MNTKLASGSRLPEMDLPLVGGGSIHLGGNRDGWQMIVVYRGKHCPLCKKYLSKLEGLAPAFNEIGAEIVALSGDPEEKAEIFKTEVGLSFPVAHGLTTVQMRTLGLYISSPRSPQETDRPFPEPAVFVLNPAGETQIIDVSNAPFSRPDLDNVLAGLRFIQQNNYPIRGTAG